MRSMLSATCSLKSPAKPVVMNTCVPPKMPPTMPSRNARHGHLFTKKGIINLNNKKYEKDSLPIDPECNCPACKSFSRSYIRHLFKAKEMLAMRLCVIHNLHFYNMLMQEIRDAIDSGTFEEYRAKYVDLLDTRI